MMNPQNKNSVKFSANLKCEAQSCNFAVAGISRHVFCNRHNIQYNIFLARIDIDFTNNIFAGACTAEQLNHTNCYYILKCILTVLSSILWRFLYSNDIFIWCTIQYHLILLIVNPFYHKCWIVLILTTLALYVLFKTFDSKYT